MRRALLAGHVVALVAILHATPSILYGTLRYAWAYKHVGIVDYIQRHGDHVYREFTERKQVPKKESMQLFNEAINLVQQSIEDQSAGD